MEEFGQLTRTLIREKRGFGDSFEAAEKQHNTFMIIMLVVGLVVFLAMAGAFFWFFRYWRQHMAQSMNAGIATTVTRTVPGGVYSQTTTFNPHPQGGIPQPQAGYSPPSQGSYPLQPQGGHPPQPQGGYPEPKGGHPPQPQGGYPEPQGGYPPQSQGGHPLQPQGGYPEPQGGYPPQPQGGHPLQPQPSAPQPLGGAAGSDYPPPYDAAVAHQPPFNPALQQGDTKRPL